MVSGTLVRFLSALPSLALPETTAERTAMIASKASTWLKKISSFPNLRTLEENHIAQFLELAGSRVTPLAPLYLLLV